MTELPAGDPHEVIHLGDEAAVVVPLAEYRELRHDARRARLIEQADAEEVAALAEYRAQQAAGAVNPEGLAQVGRYRVLYEIDPVTHSITVLRIGRVA